MKVFCAYAVVFAISHRLTKIIFNSAKMIQDWLFTPFLLFSIRFKTNPIIIEYATVIHPKNNKLTIENTNPPVNILNILAGGSPSELVPLSLQLNPNFGKQLLCAALLFVIKVFFNFVYCVFKSVFVSNYLSNC